MCNAAFSSIREGELTRALLDCQGHNMCTTQLQLFVLDFAVQADQLGREDQSRVSCEEVRRATVLGGDEPGMTLPKPREPDALHEFCRVEYDGRAHTISHVGRDGERALLSNAHA